MNDLKNTAANALTRRDFSLQAALAILAGVVITVAEGCGSSSTPAAPTPAPPPVVPAVNDVTGVISANHGHTAVISAAQITAGNMVSLDITGMATHPHSVDVSQADLATLKGRGAVVKTSSNNAGHVHTVTFTPA